MQMGYVAGTPAKVPFFLDRPDLLAIGSLVSY